MTKRLAINGFGRIGRTFLRIILQSKELRENMQVVAINIGPSDPENIATLFKYDSLMGEFEEEVKYENETLKIGNTAIKIICKSNPIDINWKDLNVDWVIESSGKFRTREKAELHLKSGCKKVLITAPAIDEDITIIPGVNEKSYDDKKHNIVSLGSCTTNCFAPIIKVIKENFQILSGLMTTIHAYTNDQVLLDSEHSDPRRARAAALNIIPTKTGAEKVITKLYPDLEGKIKALAIRVPTPIVSLVDFSFTTKEKLNRDLINKKFEEYSKDQLQGILEFCNQPLVSCDFQQNSRSCILDSLLTTCVENSNKVFAWYDNEFGYCCRLRDFLLHI